MEMCWAVSADNVMLLYWTVCVLSVYSVSNSVLSVYEATRTGAVSPANCHVLHICCLSTAVTQKNLKCKDQNVLFDGCKTWSVTAIGDC